MEKFTKFILSIPAKMVAVISLAIIACIFLTVETNKHVNWAIQNASYQLWVASDAENICKSAEEKCYQIVAEALGPKPFWETISEREECKRKIIGNMICKMYPPQNNSYSSSELKRVTWDYVVTFAMPFVLIYALKCFAFVKHSGWRRIILTFSGIVTIATALSYEATHYRVDEWELLLYVSIAFLLSISFPYIAMVFVKWIREGFTNKEEANEKLKQLIVDKSDIQYFNFSVGFVKYFCGIFGFYLMMVAVYLFYPNGREQIFAKAISGALIASFFVFWDWWKKNKTVKK